MTARFRNWVLLIACPPSLLLAGIATGQPLQSGVTSVRVEGNTLLPETTLTQLTASLPPTAPDLAALNDLAARIQRAYRDAGYGGVIAYLPPQESTTGQIVVRVVEGKIASVRVSGNKHFTTANIRAALPHLTEGATPSVRAINRDIQLTNSNPAKHVAVSLGAGKQAGTIDADVNVTDSPQLQYLVGYNNNGTPLTGRHRLSVGVEHANLFDRDHVATLQVQTSPDYPGRVQIFSAGYRVPLYAHAASFDAFVAYSTVGNGKTATPAGPLSFTGKGTIVGLRANRHLERQGEYDHHVTLGLDWRDYRDDCSIGEFGPAACGSAAVDITTTPLSLSYTGQQGGATLAFGFNAALVVNAAGSAAPTFEAARPGARRRYQLARLSGFVDKPFGAGSGITARAEAQMSAHALIPVEKFGIGGANSVRGYRERELSGDGGLLLRVELAAPTLEWQQGARLRPYVFLDHGRVSNHGDMPCRGLQRTSCQLTGTGLGLKLSMRKMLSASLDIGRAMARGASSEPGDIRGHAALNLVF